MPELTVKQVVEALKRVPEKHFRISELAPLVLDDTGKVDIAKAIDMQGELNLAIFEVQAYVKATKAALSALSGIGIARPNWQVQREQERQDEAEIEEVEADL